MAVAVAVAVSGMGCVCCGGVVLLGPASGIRVVRVIVVMVVVVLVRTMTVVIFTWRNPRVAPALASVDSRSRARAWELSCMELVSEHHQVVHARSRPLRAGWKKTVWAWLVTAGGLRAS